MKEVELPKSVDGKLNIAEVTTFENGILLVYENADVIGYIIFNDFDNPIWGFYSNINTAETREENYSLYSLIETLIQSYNITSIKLIEFNQK